LPHIFFSSNGGAMQIPLRSSFIHAFIAPCCT
jgi:hypothetical protein